LVKALFEYNFHGVVLWVVKKKSPVTGRLKADMTVLFPETDNALCRSEVVKHPVREKIFDQKLNSGSVAIDTKNYKSGIYIIKINGVNNWITKKITIE